MMTRKHFEQFAKAVAWLESADRQRAGKVLANAFADIAQRDNPRFDRGKFMRACGVEDLQAKS